MRVTLNYIATVTAIALSCDLNTISQKTPKNTFAATENP